MKIARFDMKANCGCGWKTIPGDIDPVRTVKHALDHTMATGHTTEIRGEVRMVEEE